MPYSKEEIEELDKVAKKIMGEGELKSITVPTPSGLIVEITEEKYRQLDKGGQNPINLIINTTANATATSSLSLSQEIRNIYQCLENSKIDPQKLPEARKELNKLENELNKPNPDERNLKRIIRWASDFSFELFLRLSVLLAERFLKPM